MYVTRRYIFLFLRQEQESKERKERRNLLTYTDHDNFMSGAVGRAVGILRGGDGDSRQRRFPQAGRALRHFR